MGLFNLFRKKKTEPSYDPLDVKVTDLKTGFLFDYDLNTWEVVESYEYDWGNNFFTREFKVQSSDKMSFLQVEDDDGLKITMYEKVKLRAINEDLPEYIQNNEYPPKSLNYKGIKFLKEEESPGYFRNMDEKNSQWTELIAWDYFDEDNQYTLAIEQWGEREFEAAFGKLIKPYEINNIVPAESESQ